jgi:hypothetical protein
MLCQWHASTTSTMSLVLAVVPAGGAARAGFGFGVGEETAAALNRAIVLSGG